MIRLDQKMENVTDEIRLLRDGSAARLSAVEADKVDKKTFENFIEVDFADHEKRLRRSEKFYIGALAIIGFVDFVLLIISAVKKS